MLIIVNSEPEVSATLATAVDPTAESFPDIGAARRYLVSHPEVDVVLVGPQVDTVSALQLAETMRVSRPHLGVILVRRRIDSATLTDALRAGIREVVNERDLSELNRAVRDAEQLARAMREQSGNQDTAQVTRQGTLVTVFSAKGGCGKTTLSTNLGAALAKGGRHEVCVVDLDLAFGDVAIVLQLFPAHTIADLVGLGESLDASALTSLLTPHSPGLTTLVAPVEPGTGEIPPALVAAALRLLKEQFEFVVVDTPPAFTDHVLAAFDESDVIALMATLDIPALKNLKLSLETLELLNYPQERWAVVLNRADSKVGLSVAEVEKTLRLPISVQIPSSRAVPAAINRGVPIVIDEPGHPVSVAIREFAERRVAHAIPRQVGVPAELRADRRGLLRRRARS